MHPEVLLQLANELAPLLEGMDWAIGGSLLLHRLRLEADPRDIDLVTSEAHFAGVRERLAVPLGAWTRPLSNKFVSRHFACFTSEAGVRVDVMAGIAVRTHGRVCAWRFDPQTVEQADGLPWMRPQDWRDLYALFDRPERVRQLTDYLARAGEPR